MRQISWSKKAIAIGVATGLFVMGTIAAGAANNAATLSPVNDVLSNVGLAAPKDDHGKAVSDAVHQAIEDSTPGAGRGEAVSAAACAAAHDRETLPEGGQNAQGQQDREPKVCKTPDAEEGTLEPAENGSMMPENATAKNDHGKAVSEAVHEAIANTTPGAERGEAVSAAACMAAHDRSTLPHGDQQAQPSAGEKDCSHPNDESKDASQQDQGQPQQDESHGNSQGQEHGKSGDHKLLDK